MIATWSLHDRPREQCMIATWSVHDQPRDQCRSRHVISVCPAKWSVHDSHVISAWSAMWSVHDQSRDKCMVSHMISAWSSTWSVHVAWHHLPYKWHGTLGSLFSLEFFCFDIGNNDHKSYIKLQAIMAWQSLLIHPWFKPSMEFCSLHSNHFVVKIQGSL